MSTPHAFMRRAIEISRERMLGDQAAPFGAVVVKDGEIIGEGVNQVVAKCDPTSHGEVEAIRAACKELGTWDLSGCEIYTTCEPCEMCVATIFWAKISKVYYANSLDDANQIGFDLKPLRTIIRSDVDARMTPYEQILRDEARPVLDEWARQPGFSTFQ